MNDLARDLHFALRRLRREPGHSATVVLTLALGIGLATTVLSVAHAVLLRPLPVRDQDRIVLISGETPDRSITEVPIGSTQVADYVARSRALQSAASYAYGGAIPVTVIDGSGTRRMRRASVSGGYFGVLDARPVLGRRLEPDDDAPGAEPVLVLGEAAWRRDYGADPGVVGRALRVQEDGHTYRVVGVMPRGLDHPRGVDAWATFRGVSPGGPSANDAANLIGRLRAGATISQARDEMSAFFQSPEAPAFARDARGVARTFPEYVSGGMRPALLAFAAAAALLLLIACANVANLLLLRSLRQARDVAVRVALGGSPGRIIRQRLVEHALLAALAGCGGAIVAAAALSLFRARAPAGLPRLDEIAVDRTLLLAAAAVSVAASLLCGVLPALWGSHQAPERTLRSDARQTSSRGSRLLREGLVAGQVALSLAVLSAATLIGRSLIRLQGLDPRLDPVGLLVAELSFAQTRGTPESQRAALESLMERVVQIPGVTAASPAVAPPYSEVAWDGGPTPEGQSESDAARNPLLNMELVTPDYFRTVGVPVLRGRGFAPSDQPGEPGVALLSESAAAVYWPGQDPVGKRLVNGPTSAKRVVTVIGIVPDTRYRSLRIARPTIYFPLAQSWFPFVPGNLLLRTSRTPGDLRAELTEALRTSGSGAVLARLDPFEALTAATLAQPRMNTLLLGVFATAALVLAGVGLVAVLSAMVRQRTRELGVRIALGASALQVKHLVWRRGMAVAAAGAGIGLVAALALDRVLEGLLFETSPTDAASLLLTTVAVLAAAAVASGVPAWSTGRLKAMDALRADG